MKVYQIILLGLLAGGCSYEPRSDYHSRALKMAFSHGQTESIASPWGRASEPTNCVEVDARPVQLDLNDTPPVREKLNP